MGKSSKPLTFLIHPAIAQWEEWEALQAQGHTVRVMDSSVAYDIVMGPWAWRMDGEHRKYLDLAIKEARKQRYPNAKGDE